MKTNNPQQEWRAAVKREITGICVWTSGLSPQDKDLLNPIVDGAFDDSVTHIEAATLKLVEGLHKNGWTIELPNSPLFQITTFSAAGQEEWRSPLYDTEKLPAQLKGLEGDN